MNTAEPITDPVKLNELMGVYKEGSKNHLLLAYCLNTGLRISDVLTAKVGDSLKGVWIGNEKKTGKSKKIVLNGKLQLLIDNYVKKENLTDTDYLFYSNKDRNNPISRVQAHRIVAKAGDMIGITLSCHSLRKTFGYTAYNNGIDLPTIQYIFNHSSQAVTLRYIGITQEKVDSIIMNMSVGI